MAKEYYRMHQALDSLKLEDMKKEIEDSYNVLCEGIYQSEEKTLFKAEGMVVKIIIELDIKYILLNYFIYSFFEVEK